MSLTDLHQGIIVPEHSVVVPWLESRRSLYRYIPREHFTFSTGGWPQLRFTCLGIHADFAFNFVTHPERRLVAVDMAVDDSVISTMDGLPTSLVAALGDPTYRHTHDFRWVDEQIVVDCWTCIRRRDPGDPFVYEYSKLSIEFSAGWPNHWNNRSRPLRT